MSAGWFADPSGRFGQRWYDGHAWSDQVVAANGTAISDPLPPGGAPFPPPFAGLPALPPAGAPSGAPSGAAAWRPDHPGDRTTGPSSVRLLPGATLGIGLLGVLLVALSLLGVPWVTDGPGVSFLDLSEAARDADGSEETVVWVYAVAGGFLLLAGALVGVVLAGTPLPGRPGAVTAWRIVASAGCALAVVLHTVTVVRVFRGPASPDIGAWLGIAGYFVVIGAMVLGHYRKR